MKIKVLSRNPSDYIRETKFDVNRVPRNYDRNLHPFELQREYVRALNAVKLERHFAKPFIGDLSGHREGITALTKHRCRLSILFSASYDGQVIVWDVMRRESLGSLTAHEGIVRGIVAVPTDDEHCQAFLTCGDDHCIKEWRLEPREPLGSQLICDDAEPVFSVLSKTMLTGIDQHWQHEARYITCGERIELRERGRHEAVRVYDTGVDSHMCIKFNPVETHMAVGSASDRSVIIFDLRQPVPVSKVVLEMCSSGLCWNPMEAFTFTAANDNYNLYSFDMRKMKHASCIYFGHVSAVMDVDYAPTGREFVSAGYDRTIRIFSTANSASRDVYHTRRMQRVLKVQWSLDNNFIFSGSDETDIRIWKANSSAKLGYTYPLERQAFAYQEKLKEKFAEFPQIKRIARHRHLPRPIFYATKVRHVMKMSRRRKFLNLKAHSKPGTVKKPGERRKIIVEADSE